MTRKPSPAVLEPTEAEIQHVAYMLWLRSGQLPGRELDHWLAARELLRHRHARNLPGRRRPPRPALASFFATNPAAARN